MSKKIENEVQFIPEDKTVIITVTRKNGDKHYILLDEADYLYGLTGLHFYVSPVRHKSTQMYVRTYIDGKQYQLHRLLMEGLTTEKYPEVDHIDPFATTDNRRRNLRRANRQQNMQNLRRHSCLPLEQKEAA